MIRVGAGQETEPSRVLHCRGAPVGTEDAGPRRRLGARHNQGLEQRRLGAHVLERGAEPGQVLPDRLRSTGQSREADRHHSLPFGQAVPVHGGDTPFGELDCVW